MVEQVFSGGVEEAMGRCAFALMEAGYCVLVHARQCSVQRILPRRECAKMQDEAHLRVKRCIGLGRCSVVYRLAGGWRLGGGNIVRSA